MKQTFKSLLRPKSVTDTDNPLGRPILAKNCLENDTAKDVVLRRSKRNKWK